MSLLTSFLVSVGFFLTVIAFLIFKIVKLRLRLAEKSATLEAHLTQQEKMGFEFKGLADDSLKANNQYFAELMKPLKEQIDKFHDHSQKLEVDRQKSYTRVEDELKRVIQSNFELQNQTKALKDALKKPHIRGRWGELQLKNCIELAGMSEYADVNFQDHTTLDDGQRLIPDMTVRMPGGRIVVVDAKTPIDAFMSSLEATTDTDRDNEMLRHGRHVKDHVKKLSSRAYSEALKDSPDFTVMFLPNESFLYAALETQPDLVEYALQKKILVATPPTLVGLLKVIRFGWNEERLTENAERISEAGQELHKRLVDFVSAYINVGKHLDKAKSEFEVGLSRLESRVIVQARRLEKLGAKSTKALPEKLGQRKTEAPEVTAP